MAAHNYTRIINMLVVVYWMRDTQLRSNSLLSRYENMINLALKFFWLRLRYVDENKMLQ